MRAFNPTLAEHGYEPAGSVLETNTDDLPFLVDSVKGELQARGLHVARLLHPIVGTERDGAGQIRAVRDPRGAGHRESVMHFDLDRTLDARRAGRPRAERLQGARRGPRVRARLPGDARARVGDDEARAGGRGALRRRRGRGGRRLPRLAAARRVRVPRRARVRLHGRQDPARPRLRPRDPRRRVQLGVRRGRRVVRRACRSTSGAARSRATCCSSTSRTRSRPSTAATGWTTSACAASRPTARSSACRA